MQRNWPLVGFTAIALLSGTTAFAQRGGSHPARNTSGSGTTSGTTTGTTTGSGTCTQGTGGTGSTSGTGSTAATTGAIAAQSVARSLGVGGTRLNVTPPFAGSRR